MAWIQVGPHKINTALVCYVEREGDDTVRVYFQGAWEGNPLDIHFDEARALWKHLKAEDVMMVGKEKGSTMVLPRSFGSDKPASSSASPGAYDLGPEKPTPTDKPAPPEKPNVKPPSSSHSSHKPHPPKH